MRVGQVLGPSTLIGVAVLSCAAPSASADSITIGASRNNTLIQDSLGALGSGGAQAIFAGVTAQGSGVDKRRALIQFDIANSVPAGATITSVSLSLYCDRASNSSSSTFELHRLIADWGQGSSNRDNQGAMGAPAQSGDATWTSRFFGTGQNWTQPGGDFIAAASATRSQAGVGVYTWSSTSLLIADVQGWLNNPSSNFGWLIKNNESSTRNARRFSGITWPEATQRPALTIVYTVPAPGAAVVMGLGGLIAMRRRR
ncbi:MAG: DNRLRE domain-containing protein [Tepidisphaera sp.]|nr:DNRLRE domain-containing protein [Tepidisphaera sp.]